MRVAGSTPICQALDLTGAHGLEPAGMHLDELLQCGAKAVWLETAFDDRGRAFRALPVHRSPLEKRSSHGGDGQSRQHQERSNQEMTHSPSPWTAPAPKPNNSQ